MDPAPALTASSRALRRRLPRAFYARGACSLARDLLGRILVVGEEAGGLLAARIVEVEAYRGPGDRAAHSAGGRRTPRNETMWGEAGRLYVYRIYGLHHCANLVAARPGRPEAVLLRGLDPLLGRERMALRRGRPPGDPALARGPGNLARALGLDLGDDGLDLAGGGRLWVADLPPHRPEPRRRSPRIGVDYAGEDALRPWRFYLAGAAGVSGPAALRR